MHTTGSDTASTFGKTTPSALWIGRDSWQGTLSSGAKKRFSCFAIYATLRHHLCGPLNPNFGRLYRGLMVYRRRSCSRLERVVWQNGSRRLRGLVASSFDDVSSFAHRATADKTADMSPGTQSPDRRRRQLTCNIR